MEFGQAQVTDNAEGIVLEDRCAFMHIGIGRATISLLLLG
jgi:hypothetical protein